MPIKYTNPTLNESLYDFYEEHSKSGNQPHQDSAKNMMKVLDLLNQLFPTTQLLGTTSHLRLVLSPIEAKTEGNQWKVIIENIGLENYYYIQYKLPKNIEPWDNAWVTGTEIAFRDLSKYILIAMDRSQGWLGNEELKQAIDS